MKTLYFDEIPSTNTYAKTLLSTGENTVIVAKRQTGGRGTKGRSFCSNEGGVYLTKLSFFEKFPAKNAFLIMAAAATAVCKTLEVYGLNAQIKWPNDVFVSGKKICGILIENVFSGSRVAASIVGIGLNVTNPLGEELKDIAITMSQLLKTPPKTDDVTKTLLDFLAAPFEMQDYSSRLGFLNMPVALIEGEQVSQVVALGVTERGELIVKDAEKARLVQAGEVSLRV